MTEENFSTHKGQILRHTMGFYQVELPSGEEIACKAKSTFIHPNQANQLAIGDAVKIQKFEQGGFGRILEVFPRTSVFQRKRTYFVHPHVVAANVDFCLMVASIHNPPIRGSLLARFLILADWGKIQPILVLTKSDLATKEETEFWKNLFEKIQVSVFAISSHQKLDLDRLKKTIEGKISMLIGHSGVGKSSLLNQLFPNVKVKTAPTNAKTQKGRHTTSLAAMYKPEKNFSIIDTPGVRDCQLFFDDITLVGRYYPPFHPFEGKCSIKNCIHLSEANCAIKNAVVEGRLDPWFYKAYQKCLEQENKTHSQSQRLKK